MTKNKEKSDLNIVPSNFVDCKISKREKKIGISGNVIEENSLEVIGYGLEAVAKEFDKRWLKNDNKKSKERR